MKEDLIKTAEKGDFKKVVDLLQQGADINAQDEKGQTALMKAILNQDERLSLFLIEKGALLDVQDCFKNTALMYTALGAQKKVFLSLLNHGASPAFEDERGDKVADLLYRCYQLASEEKKEEYQEMITIFVPDFVHREKQKALSLAIVNGLDGVVASLMQADDVNVNETDGARLAPLHWASAFNRVNAAFCLIKAGADLNMQTQNGMTALMYAAKNGHQEMAKLLLESGADITLQNKEGKTAAGIAFEKNQIEIFELIKKEGMRRITPKQRFICIYQEKERGSN